MRQRGKQRHALSSTVATGALERVKCDESELIWAVNINYILDFDDLV